MVGDFNVPYYAGLVDLHVAPPNDCQAACADRPAFLPHQSSEASRALDVGFATAGRGRHSRRKSPPCVCRRSSCSPSYYVPNHGTKVKFNRTANRYGSCGCHHPQGRTTAYHRAGTTQIAWRSSRRFRRSTKTFRRPKTVRAGRSMTMGFLLDPNILSDLVAAE